MTNYLDLTLPAASRDAVSVLGLAHIGDAVYELMVRAWLVSEGRTTTRALHRLTVKHVNAAFQAGAAALIAPLLSESEAAVLRRGRNARVKSVPKHAELKDYHAATGLEALFGWLWLGGERERLSELFNIIMEGENAS